KADDPDVEELRKLVEQRAGDALDVGAPRQLGGHAAHALELPLTGRAPGARSATAKDREQEQRGGRGAAERANGREPVWDPHWASGIVRRAFRRARNRARTWKSPPLGGSVRRALPIAPRKASKTPRGSHRPVEGRLEPVCEPDNGP